MNKTPNKSSIAYRLSEFRHSLSYIDALPQLTFLGLLVGLITGSIIICFRMLIEIPFSTFLPIDSEGFESLSTFGRVLSVFLGIALLILMASIASPRHREIGVSHVLDRMHNHQAKLPFNNWLTQFVGALICMISGQSVGREGPVVHLGAGAASQFGQWLRLPNNSIHTLVGCGVAAAISASFDTPMAGVIFAMEVLALEYTIVGFVPVILASVMGAMVSKAAFGNAVFITVGDTNMASLYEVPVMVMVGIAIAVCAGLYIRLNIAALKFPVKHSSIRLLIAGGLTAAMVIWVPQIMGQGYDTVNAVASGEMLIHTLFIVGLAKLIITPVVIGLGVPGGLIGPLLVIGACIGGAIGHTAHLFFPELGVNPSFYVMMGMAGMMAAALNAPLTALVTVLELSYNPNIIFPAMLVIVVACVTTRQLFRVKGIFVEQLLHSNRPLDFGPAKQSLRRAGVRSVMDSRFALCPQKTDMRKAKNLLLSHPMWLIIVNEDGRYSHAMRAADLANFLDQSNLDESSDTEANQDTLDDEIDILEIPSRNYRVGAIHESASLYEAMQGFRNESTEVLYVSGRVTPYSGEIKGVLTLPSIENYYKPVEFRNAVD